MLRMTGEQFTKLMGEFKKLDDKIDSLETKIDHRFDGLYTILDQHTAMLDKDESERLALNKQVDRHEDWIERSSKKIGIRYTHNT